MTNYSLKTSLHDKLRCSRDYLFRGLSCFFNLCPIKKNKVVLSNFNGRGFGDNPKYIAIEMHKRKGYELIWIANNENEEFPSYIKPVKRKSIRSLYHMSTAQIWIDNTRKDPFYIKRKGQYYLQTWHGSIALKRIERDVENVLDSYYIKNAKRDSKMIDLMISDSAFTDQLFSNSFWYGGEIKRFGSPRLDCLFQEGKRDTIRENLNISTEQYVVLYAPTFRNSLRLDVYDIDLNSIRSAFKEKMGKPVVVLVRMHPNLTWILKENIIDGAIDVTDYPDVYELLLAADALITDYSSLMFEFPIVNAKPVFCYARDLNEYDRGFYFKLNELPFSFYETNNDLKNGIESFDPTTYSKKLEKFYSEIEIFNDGNASYRVVDYIDRIVKNTR